MNDKDKQLIWEAYNIHEETSASQGSVILTKSEWGPYGVEFEPEERAPRDASGDYEIGINDMVVSLLDNPEVISKESKEKMIAAQERMKAEGQEDRWAISSWDADVFTDYYGVDIPKVVEAWAREAGWLFQSGG